MPPHVPNHTYPFLPGLHSQYTTSSSPYHESHSSPDNQDTLNLPGARNHPQQDPHHSSRPQPPTSARQDSSSPSTTARFPSARHPPPASHPSLERFMHNRAPSNDATQLGYSEWTSMRGTASDHQGTSPRNTTGTIFPVSLPSPSLPSSLHPFSQRENNTLLPRPPTLALAGESNPSSPPSLSPVKLSSSPVDHGGLSAESVPDVDPSTTYSFVPLPAGSHVKKRPRRRYDEIERLYSCTFENCTKAYGTLNHLNAHINMQKHGPKRDPTEFKELRKVWKTNKDKKDDNASDAQSALSTSNTPSTSSTPTISESSSSQPQQPSEVAEADHFRRISSSPDSVVRPGPQVGSLRSGSANVSAANRRPELHRLQIPSLPSAVPRPQTTSQEWRPSYPISTATATGPYSAPPDTAQVPTLGRRSSSATSSISSYSTDENRDEGAPSPGMYFSSPFDVSRSVQSGSIYDQHRVSAPPESVKGGSMDRGRGGSLLPPLSHRSQLRAYGTSEGSSSSYHHHSLPSIPMQHHQRESPEAIYHHPAPQHLPLQHQLGAEFATYSHSHSTGPSSSPSYPASAPSTSPSLPPDPFVQRDEQRHQSYSYQDLRGDGGNTSAYSSQHHPSNLPMYRQQQQPQQGTAAEAQNHTYHNSSASNFAGGYYRDHIVHDPYQYSLPIPSPACRNIETTGVRPQHAPSSSGYFSPPNATSGPTPLCGPLDPNSTLLTPLNSEHANSESPSLFSSPGPLSRPS